MSIRKSVARKLADAPDRAPFPPIHRIGIRNLNLVDSPCAIQPPRGPLAKPTSDIEAIPNFLVNLHRTPMQIFASSASAELECLRQGVYRVPCIETARAVCNNTIYNVRGNPFPSTSGGLRVPEVGHVARHATLCARYRLFRRDLRRVQWGPLRRSL